jgi:hypothetical protein
VARSDLEPPSLTREWIELLYRRVGGDAFPVKGYSIATVPPASQWAAGDFSSLIYVNNAAGGASMAFSNGTNWISVITGNPI